MIEEESQWYVFQAMYGRALMAQSILSALSINSYVPMVVKPTTSREAKPVVAPILSNLIFIETTFSRIKELRATYDFLYYLSDSTSGERVPMIVQRDQMEQFINFVEDRFNAIEYISPTSFDIRKGERVKIIDGAFQGKEGVFVKVAGKQRKQIVVAIDGLLAVSIKSPKPWTIIERI